VITVRPPSPTPTEIKEARGKAGLNQTEAAQAIYSVLRTWQDWESGKAKMHPGLWELFCIKMLNDA
jgi:DNA (cytosine-5)-methyltransferase 1